MGEQAIITVNAHPEPFRQKFSIGHELGHWFKDKGKVGNLCATSDIVPAKHQHSLNEGRANQFASELLMPHFLMTAELKDRGLNQQTVRHIAEHFDCSLMAALKRTITMDRHMGFMACIKKMALDAILIRIDDYPAYFSATNNATRLSYSAYY